MLRSSPAAFATWSMKVEYDYLELGSRSVHCSSVRGRNGLHQLRHHRRIRPAELAGAAGQSGTRPAVQGSTDSNSFLAEVTVKRKAALQSRQIVLRQASGIADHDARGPVEHQPAVVLFAKSQKNLTRFGHSRPTNAIGSTATI